MIAVIGITGIAARIIWPTASERGMGYGRTLRLLGLLSMVSALVLALAAADLAPSWSLVPAAVLLGAGAIAWNAVGMLAVGFSVDLTGSYVPGWIGAAALLAGCAVIAGRIPARGTLITP